MKLLEMALCAVPLISAACLDSSESPLETVAPPAATDEPSSEDAGQHLTTTEGEFGRVRVQTPDGPMLLSYQVVNGHAIHELDVDLGPVEKLLARGGAARLGARWPNGIVYFAFDPDFTGNRCSSGGVNCTSSRQVVRDTLEAMEEKLPFDFREVAHDAPQNKVIFTYEPGQESAGRSDSIGMAGGDQHISFRTGHEGDKDANGNPVPAYPYYNNLPNGGTTRHEMLHAVGLWHEQSRNDRNEFVDVNYECIKDGESNGNYDIKDESADLGPYDFASIMHYGDRTQCIKPIWSFQDPDGDGCICKTMDPIPSGATIGGDGVSRGGFSIEDANTVYRMYADPIGTNEAGDKYGKAFAVGDFDGDGYDDLAVGTPNEDLSTGIYPNITTVTDAGHVSIWKGTPGGLVAWRGISAVSFEGQSLSAGAKFGTALAAYDVNADGVDDLAIGAPGAVGGAGAVFVFRGTRTNGFVAHRYMTQANTYVDDDGAGDRFGEALAAGPITGSVRADACGPNLPYEALVVGAPGDAVPMPFSGSSKRGSVFIFHENRPSCSDTSTLNAGTKLEHGWAIHGGGLSGDDFGAALAVGDIDGDGLADVAVGAPNYNNDAGKVYLYKGRLPSENVFAWSAMATEQTEVVSSNTVRFGAAIAIGKVLPIGMQLAVGAPGNAGKVTVFTVANWAATTQVTLTSASEEVGDEFGASLAIGDVDRFSATADLVIGAPGEDSDAGEIVIARGGTNGLPTRTVITQTSPLMFGADRDANDRYGEALAIGSFDGADGRSHTFDSGVTRLDLAVGATGEKPDFFPYAEDPNMSGAVDVLRGASGTTPSAWLHRHQENAGRLSDPS